MCLIKVFILYVSETRVLYTKKSLKHTTIDIAREFSIVSDWFVANKLYVNIDKNEYNVFANKNCTCKMTGQVNYNIIKRVQSTKFVGNHMDKKINMAFVYCCTLN